jgi:YgiT-type zinc finger domain-containing protein
MDRTTTLRVAGNVASHVRCWECPACGEVIAE